MGHSVFSQMIAYKLFAAAATGESEFDLCAGIKEEHNWFLQRKS